MEQSAHDAASMAAIINPNEMVFAEDMGPIKILLTNLLHLIHHIDQHMPIRPQLFPIIILPQILPTKSMVEFLVV